MASCGKHEIAVATHPTTTNAVTAIAINTTTLEPPTQLLLLLLRSRARSPSPIRRSLHPNWEDIATATAAETVPKAIAGSSNDIIIVLIHKAETKSSRTTCFP